ncbi:MAG TPA: hypothetical protein VL987_12205 [Cellvibrio sp.]|nr:hypothetical protein [Cellvibrio sp.]
MKVRLPVIQVRETDLIPVRALSQLELKEKFPGVIMIKKVGVYWTGVIEVPKKC